MKRVASSKLVLECWIVGRPKIVSIIVSIIIRGHVG